MSMAFEVKSPAELKAIIGRLTRIFPDGVAQAMWVKSNVIMNEALPQVPVDFGYLRSTAYVNDAVIDASGVSVEMGFYAKYARPVHEIPEPPMRSVGGRSAHHEHGKWHFLKDPLDEHIKELPADIVAQVEAYLGGEL